jgi:TonB family protein
MGSTASKAARAPAQGGGRLGLGGSLALSAGLHAALAGCGLLVVLGHAQRPGEEEPTSALYLAQVKQDPSWYQSASDEPSASLVAALAEEPMPQALELELPEVPKAELVPQALEAVERPLEVEPELEALPPGEVDWGSLGSESLADLRELHGGSGSAGVGRGSVAGVGPGNGGGRGAGGNGIAGVRPGLGRGNGAGPDFRPGGAQAAAAAAAASTGEDRPLALLESPRPAYPRVSLRLGEEGDVLVRIHVDEAGRVSGVDVLESSGHERLDEAARKGVRSWRFEPELRGGQPVASTFDHRIIFVIESAG